jgi:FMN-dependent oxidoreductase (nitrilotriacetate monooxygenase family)
MPLPKDHPRTIILGAFIHAAGYHVAGWRYPGAVSATEDIGHLTQICQIAERGKFHLAFLGDGLSISADTAPSMLARLEPLTLLSAIAVNTRHIGLAATASTTYGEPFHIARQFASLDHISGGRAGWNVVTSANPKDGANFSKASHMEHGARYERAEEFVEVVRGLWDTWEAGALVRDKATGQYVDSSKLHALDHRGPHFSVAGPLNISRSPQGHPVLIQAGSSGPGQRLASRIADVIFTAQQNLPAAKSFYREIKQEITRQGRSADQVFVMPGIMPIVGRTDEEARAKFDYLQSLIDTDNASAALSQRFGIDMSAYPIDGPLPEDLPQTNGFRSRVQLLTEMARNEHMTLRELYRAAAISNGHHVIVGSAERVADELEAWFAGAAADGFNIMAPYFPGALQDFVDLVVPVLQARGLYHLDYRSTTLRGNLGLRPVESCERQLSSSAALA